jgi:hypothetical protein
MVAHLLTYPNDVLRRRLQMDGADGARPRYRGYVDCALQVVRSEGWAGLYRGLGVCMVRAVPNTGIQFMVYEGCKDMLMRRK